MKTIMIIDDSASIRNVVRITLKSAGYDVIEARDGQDALNQLKGQKVNLIITDVNMPNMDGITFVLEAKKLNDYKFTPMMMLTTENAAEKVLEGKAAGAKAWLYKPFQPLTLLEAVSKLVIA